MTTKKLPKMLFGKVQAPLIVPAIKNLSTVWKLIEAEVVQMKAVQMQDNSKPTA